MDAGSKQSTPHSIPDDYSVSRGTEEDSFSDSQDAEEEDANAIILDPSDSERHYWRDIITKIDREIWRPGDGDGDRATDYFDKTDPPTNIEERWKFYQLSLGRIKYNHNEPPKYVFLDDRACYEVLQSNIPRASLGKFWPHDFGLSGKIRDRRPHRGRGAIGDPDAEGNDRFHFAYVGMKNGIYYFTGEKDYTPIIYQSEELSAEIEKKLEKKRKGWSVRNTEADPKNKGHNQFTPKDWLVKNGAPSNAKSNKKKKKSLADHKVPEWLLDKPRPVGGLTTPDATLYAHAAAMDDTDAALPQWIPHGTTESQPKRRKLDGHDGPTPQQHSSSPSQMFPFHGQTVEYHPVPYNPLAPIGNGTHQESTCPYTESRTYASQLEKDLATAHDVISEQKGKIAQLEEADMEKEEVIEQLRRELQDLRWSIGR